MLGTAQRLGARNVRLFGSIARGEDTERSDVDLLVDVPRGTTLLDMVRLQRAIEPELGVSVDVLSAGDFPPERASASFRKPFRCDSNAA